MWWLRIQGGSAYGTEEDQDGTISRGDGGQFGGRRYLGEFGGRQRSDEGELGEGDASHQERSHFDGGTGEGREEGREVERCCLAGQLGKLRQHHQGLREEVRHQDQ